MTKFPGKGLTNTQVQSSKGGAHCGVVNQGGTLERGARLDPPSGGKLPGKGKESKRTRNSPNPRA